MHWKKIENEYQGWLVWEGIRFQLYIECSELALLENNI